jgi:hypothetical protein
MPATNPAGTPPNGEGSIDRDDVDDRCDELVAGHDEDGPTAYECGAPLRRTETGYSCGRGHAYTYAAYREAEGWDYASDPVEAELLARAGVVGVRPGDARPWL